MTKWQKKQKKYFSGGKDIMKKKAVSILLVAVMAVGMLAGCGNGKSSVSQNGSDGSTDSNEKVEMADAKDVDGTTITF